MKLIIEDRNSPLYTEKQFQSKIYELFYKYFPDGECWVKSLTARAAHTLSVHCFAQENDDNDTVNNIDCLNIDLNITSGRGNGHITFPLTLNSDIEIKAIYSSIKTPEGIREQIPFKQVYGNPDKILRSLNGYFKNVRTIYDEYYS